MVRPHLWNILLSLELCGNGLLQFETSFIIYWSSAWHIYVFLLLLIGAFIVPWSLNWKVRRSHLEFT